MKDKLIQIKDDLQKIIDRLDYGDITKDKTVADIDNAIADLLDVIDDF